MNKNWLVYIILCCDGTLYTGITNNLARRFQEHQTGGPKGAKYLRSHPPKQVVYTENCENRSLATKRELEIKKLTKIQKELLIQANTRKLRKGKIA